MLTLVLCLMRRSACLSAFLEADLHGLCWAFVAPSLFILCELSPLPFSVPTIAAAVDPASVVSLLDAV
jgi:hypothetical protein